MSSSSPGPFPAGPSSKPLAGWQLTADLSEFLARGEKFLHSEPALHTALLSASEVLRMRGPQAYGKAAPLFGTYADADGTVRGAFLWTKPHRLALGPATAEAADALARQLAVDCPDLPGVGADRATAEAFARVWERRTGAAAVLGARQRLYRLGTLTVPEPVPPGRARVATSADRALLARWHQEFGEAVGERPAMAPGDWADTRLAYGGVTLWETSDGAPAAMAGVTPRVAGQVRVAPVYTPAALRGRGFGGAATVAATRAALAAEVLLFTDLDNPTSNSLYQRIGYRPVRDFAQYEFGGGPGREA
ncbi:GNAT family N-acetyltransferase [Streptomyces sp. NPDC058284]|uniref:GNAT family N-acetyltransferase n=1 Tax=unclassified Streptomyces TaxID=2593676 RepID=UPI003663788A